MTYSRSYLTAMTDKVGFSVLERMSKESKDVKDFSKKFSLLTDDTVRSGIFFMLLHVVSGVSPYKEIFVKKLVELHLYEPIVDNLKKDVWLYGIESIMIFATIATICINEKDYSHISKLIDYDRQSKEKRRDMEKEFDAKVKQYNVDPYTFINGIMT